MKKRLLSMLLAGAMVMSLMDVAVFAEPTAETAQEASEGIISEDADIDVLLGEGEDENKVDLEIVNDAGMFKAASASVVTEDGKASLVVALNSTGYTYLIPGTYESAVAAGDQRDTAWITYTVNAAGKYEFIIPLEDGQTEIPAVSVSKSYLEKYDNGTATLARSFYPRLFKLDLENKSLRVEEYSGQTDLAVTNNYKMFKILDPAVIETVGGPNSNAYKNTLTLYLDKNSYTKLYFGAGDQVEDDKVVDIADVSENGVTKYAFTFDFPISAYDQPVNIALYSAKNDRWYTRKITVSKASGTLVTDNNAADYTAVEDAIKAIPADMSGYAADKVAAVNAAVDAVVWGKAADEEGVVDTIAAMAEAINAAVAALGKETFSFSCQASFWDESKDFATATFDQVAVKLVDEDNNVVFDQVGLYDADNKPLGLKVFTKLEKGKTYTLTMSREGYGLAEKLDWSVELHRYIYQFTGEDVFTQTVTADDANKNFIATFVKKPQAIADAMAKVPADLTMFTDETAAALQAAISAADEKETAESVVQKMADAIVEAVQNLIPKDGVYTAAQVASDKLSSASRQLIVYNGQMYLKVVTKSTSMDYAYAGNEDDAPNDEAAWIEPTIINNGTKDVNVFVFPVEKLSTTFDTACRSAKNQKWYGYHSIVEAHTLTKTDEEAYNPTLVKTALTVDNKTGMFKIAEAYLVTNKAGDKYIEMSIGSTSYKYLAKGTFEAVEAAGYTPDQWCAGEPAKVMKDGKEVDGYIFKLPVEEGESYIPAISVSNTHLNAYLAGTEDLYRCLFARQFTLDEEALTLVTDDYKAEADYAVVENGVDGVTVSAATMKTVGAPASNNYEMTLVLTFEEDVDQVGLGGEENAVAVTDKTVALSMRKNKTGGALVYDYLDGKVNVCFHTADGWCEGYLITDTKAKTVAVTGVMREYVSIASSKRYDTAAAIAETAYALAHGEDAVPEGVIIVNSHSFADALAANAYAGLVDYPMLISKTDSVADAVTGLLNGKWHGVKKVVFIGLGFYDTNAKDVKPAIKKALTACGVEEFETIGGNSRYDTAEAVYDEILKLNPNVDKVIVTTGNAAADALSASSMSYSECYPILLVNKGKAHDTTLARISANDNITEVIALGGEGVVNNNVACGKPMTRLFGQTRYETSRAIADYYAATCGATTNTNVGFAHGDDDHFSDALVGGQLMGTVKAPVLLICERSKHLDGIQTYVKANMAGNAGKGGTYYFLGYVAQGAGGSVNYDNMVAAIEAE